MSAARVARVGWLVLLQAHVALAGGAADVTHKSQASLIVPRSQPVITALFEPSTTGEALGYPCFRQPELTPLGSTGELIAWTEAYPGATGGANGSCAPAAREEKATTAAAAERGESSDMCVTWSTAGRPISVGRGCHYKC